MKINPYIDLADEVVGLIGDVLMLFVILPIAVVCMIPLVIIGFISRGFKRIMK